MRILAIDDTRTLRELLCRTLRAAQHDVIEAEKTARKSLKPSLLRAPPGHHHHPVRRAHFSTASSTPAQLAGSAPTTAKYRSSSSPPRAASPRSRPRAARPAPQGLDASPPSTHKRLASTCLTSLRKVGRTATSRVPRFVSSRSAHVTPDTGPAMDALGFHADLLRPVQRLRFDKLEDPRGCRRWPRATRGVRGVASGAAPSIPSKAARHRST